jgi:hypothetical protein
MRRVRPRSIWTELHPAIAPRPSLTEWARVWAFAQVGHRDDTVASNRRVPRVSVAYKQPERVVRATVGEYNGVFALVVE